MAAGRKSTRMCRPDGDPCFPTRPKTEWLEDGRCMQLLEAFSFIDSAQKTWKTLDHSVVDGASIPPVFWSIVGGPYEGRYRNASVVHDVECDLRRERWQDVHRMFHEACIAGGVRRLKALLLYAAVYLFGPKWTSPEGAPIEPAKCTMDDAIRLSAWVRQQQRISLQAIEALTPKLLKPQVKQVALKAERKRIIARHLRTPGKRYALDPVLDD